jgi:hypothetical protein
MKCLCSKYKITKDLLLDRFLRDHFQTMEFHHVTVHAAYKELDGTWIFPPL